MSADEPLADRTIGVPESRQLDLFAQMLEQRGARVVRCPLVAIRDAPDPGPIHAWIETVLADGLDDMIWLTGEGVRRIDGFFDNHDLPDHDAFWQRLAGSRHITRGPKPGRALKPLGITAPQVAPQPTTDGVIAALADMDLRDHRVGVQLYGTDPNAPLMAALARAGANALPVAPYVYADAAEDERVTKFIDAIVAGDLDALAFTSSPQITRLFKIATSQDRSDSLKAAMARRCIAAVGPLTAEALQEHGVHADLVPENSYFMKPLVRRLASHFGTSPPD